MNFDDLCCCCVECNSFDCFSEPMLCLFFDFSSCLCFCRSFSEKESFKMMKIGNKMKMQNLKGEVKWGLDNDCRC